MEDIKKEFKVYATPKDSNVLKAVILFAGLWLVFKLNQQPENIDEYRSGTGEVDPKELEGLTEFTSDLDKAKIVQDCISTIGEPFDLLDKLSGLIIETEEEIQDTLTEIENTQNDEELTEDDIDDLRKFQVYFLDTDELVKLVLYLQATEVANSTVTYFCWNGKTNTRTLEMRAGTPTEAELKDTTLLVETIEIGNVIENMCTDMGEALDMLSESAQMFFAMCFAVYKTLEKPADKVNEK